MTAPRGLRWLPWVRRAAKRRQAEALAAAREWQAEERAKARERLLRAAQEEQGRH